MSDVISNGSLRLGTSLTRNTSLLVDEAQGGQVVAAKLESQVAMLAARQVKFLFTTISSRGKYLHPNFG